MAPPPFIGTVDMSKVHFGPMMNNGTKQHMEMFKDDTTTKSNRLTFNLCSDPRYPMQCKYPLDSVKPDQDGLRRGLTVNVEQSNTLSALRALDDRVIAHARSHCKEIFKKPSMTDDEILLRYNRLVKDHDNGTSSIKFKVKCGGQVPTELHLIDEQQRIVLNKATLSEITECAPMVSPILSVYGLWFMGSSFGITIQAEKMLVKPGIPPSPVADFLITENPMQVVIEASSEQKRGRDDDPGMGGELDEPMAKAFKPSADAVQLLDDSSSTLGDAE